MNWTATPMKLYGPVGPMVQHGGFAAILAQGNMDYHGGMYTSVDSGLAWVVRTQTWAFSPRIITCMGIRSNITTDNLECFLWTALPGVGLFFSGDTGRTWSSIAPSQYGEQKLLAPVDSILVILDRDSKVYRTPDNGLT